MSNESRRKLLKSIAAGSGAIVAGKSLPETWSRPVVDSVMLPVHAQTSLVPYSYHYTEDVSVELGQLNPESNNTLFASILGGLVPLANAQDFNARVDVCIDYGYENMPDKWRAAARVQSLVEQGPYGAGDLISMYTCEGGTINGPALDMKVRICCDESTPDTTMQVTRADGTGADFTITQVADPEPQILMETAPIGACPFGDPDNETCNCGG